MQQRGERPANLTCRPLSFFRTDIRRPRQALRSPR
jgi:hypothetical protein